MEEIDIEKLRQSIYDAERKIEESEMRERNILVARGIGMAICLLLLIVLILLSMQ